MTPNLSFNTLIPEFSVFDCEKTVDFYTNILGFTIAYQRTDEGFAFLRLGNAQIMVDQIGKGRTWQTGEFKYPLGIGINLQIDVPDLTPIQKSLTKNKIQLFLEPEEKWYRVDDHEEGVKQLIIQDPNGYLLRFSEDIGNRSVK